VSRTSDLPHKLSTPRSTRIPDDRFELLWAVLENLSEGVVACDADGTLSFFNRATREFHGIPEEAISPDAWAERYSLYRADGTPMPPEDIPLLRALHGENVHDTVMVIAPRDRDSRTVICSGQPLHDASGKLLGAVVVMRDITQQITAERQRAALIHEREINRAKDEFLANVAHELRNPLTSILAWTQMLQLKEEESRTALAAIESSTRMQAQLIDDLSDVARIAAGKLALSREHVLLRDILETAITGARPSAEVKRIVIAPTTFEENIVLEGDRLRLQQVFWNLLTNSIKFTRDGGRITIDVVVQDSRVRVTVRDTGRGISAEFLPRVFERYAQEPGTTNGHPGLGIGLSIARTIVELHSGSITAASAGEGTGATFEVTLPLANQLASDVS
jgi:PAS domain S-box-containing protein